MKELEANRQAWGLLSADHYRHYKPLLQEGSYRLNRIIEAELGDLSGLRAIHLQCNTGTDTILLAEKCAQVTGVDFVPDNILYARKMAAELGVANVDFLEADVLSLAESRREPYDVVFTSEGVIGWLPDLAQWGRSVRRLLRDGGFFYVFDSHPFGLMMDEERLARGELAVRYPYFDRTPEAEDAIGGYASELRAGRNYFWMYTLGDVVNALAGAGLRIEFLHEFEECFYDLGGMRNEGGGLWSCDFNRGRFPLSFSLRATCG